MSNVAISDAIKKLKEDPSALMSMMEETLPRITPDMMSKAKNVAKGEQGKAIIDQMTKQGLDIAGMRASIREQTKLINRENQSKEKRVVLHITASRQCKPKSIPLESLMSSASSLIRSGIAVELQCSRLSVGPLCGRTIKVLVDPQCGGRNKRSTKIMGYPVGSEIVIFDPSGDLSESDLLSVEDLLE